MQVKSTEQSRLFQNLVAQMEKQNWSKATDLACRMLAADLRDRYMFHGVLAAFIDGGEIRLANRAWDIYRKIFPPNGYGDFYAGRIAHLNGDWSKAEGYFRRALTDENLSPWYRGAVCSILGTLCREEGRAEEAVEFYRQAAELKPPDKGKLHEYSNYLFNLHYLNKSQSFMLTAARRYGDMLKVTKKFAHQKRRRAKIRVGYISPDLRFHVAAFFSGAFFNAYNPQKFEIFAYTNCVEDEISQKLRSRVTGWRNVRSLDFAEIAEIIYRDGIDILVDLAGHTAGNLLPVLAFKPAPVQISGIGYFDTTGLEQTDYFLADIYTDPPANDAYFTEKLLRLPHSHFCFTPLAAYPKIRPTPSLVKGFVTFGSFNAFAKITDKMLAAWAKILRAVPRSRLYLKAAIFNNPQGEEIVLQRLTAAGISHNRVIFSPHERDYLSCYHQIDIALDSYPYPGGGTTCDALYMGVPVVSLAGERHNARFGYSLLKNLGLDSCIAFSEEEYIGKAVNLALNRRELNELRLSLRSRMENSPLMQEKKYMRDIEALYERVWEKWIKNK